jgi:hypothetical protein
MMKAIWPLSLQPEETLSALDKFFEIPENGPIAVNNALYVVSLRADGTDEPAIEKEVREFRARATNR